MLSYEEEGRHGHGSSLLDGSSLAGLAKVKAGVRRAAAAPVGISENSAIR